MRLNPDWFFRDLIAVLQAPPSEGVLSPVKMTDGTSQAAVQSPS